jgi:circadian clock protein KaiC
VSKKTKKKKTSPKQSSSIAPQEIAKVSTGIAGLDEVLEGGLPAGRTTLIRGGPGTGKTMLGLEFLVNGARAGKPGLLVCFEETAAVLRSNAQSLGWDLAAMETSGTLLLWDVSLDPNSITAGDFSIDAFLTAIQGQAECLGAQRLMIDALDVLTRLFDDPARRERELYRLHGWLAKRSYTTLLTAKGRPLEQASREDALMDYLADCVLLLDLRIHEQVTTRRLRVLKYRGSDFRSNEYPYIITGRGSVIMPITNVRLVHQASRAVITSGCASFDACLGGGFRKGSGIIISGPTGCGKTTLAATFTCRACGDGDKVLYVSFEESPQDLCANMRSPGLDLVPFAEQGRLVFHSVMPEALVPEGHLVRIMAILNEFNPDHMVVDAMSACARMGGYRAAFDFMIRLIDACKERGVTCIMIQQMTDREHGADEPGLGLASVVDTLVQIRFAVTGQQRHRELIVIKSRGIPHSHRYHAYHITDNGIHVDKPVSESRKR